MRLVLYLYQSLCMLILVTSMLVTLYVSIRVTVYCTRKVSLLYERRVCSAAEVKAVRKLLSKLKHIQVTK